MTTAVAYTSLRWTRAVAVTLGVSLVAACSQPAPPPAPAAPAVKSTEARAQVYQECWGYFNNKDWDKFAACYTENAVSDSPGNMPPSTMGRAPIIERAKKEAEAFPDRRGDVQLVLASGAHIMSIATYTATNTGPMPPGPDGKSMPATNKKIGIHVAHVGDWDATGGALTRDAVYGDNTTMLAQLGVVKNPMARKVLTPAAGPATVVIAKNDDREKTNLATLQTIMDAINKHDLKALEASMTDDYKVMDVGQPKDLNKKESMAATKEFFGAFGDMKMTPSATWAAGDYVVLEGDLAGTNTGPMPSMGIAKATNKKFNGRFIEVMKLENGKVKEDWIFYNGAELAAQLGGN